MQGPPWLKTLQPLPNVLQRRTFSTCVFGTEDTDFYIMTTDPSIDCKLFVQGLCLIVHFVKPLIHWKSAFKC